MEPQLDFNRPDLAAAPWLPINYAISQTQTTWWPLSDAWSAAGVPKPHFMLGGPHVHAPQTSPSHQSRRAQGQTVQQPLRGRNSSTEATQVNLPQTRAQSWSSVQRSSPRSERVNLPSFSRDDTDVIYATDDAERLAPPFWHPAGNIVVAPNDLPSHAAQAAGRSSRNKGARSFRCRPHDSTDSMNGAAQTARPPLNRKLTRPRTSTRELLNPHHARRFVADPAQRVKSPSVSLTGIIPTFQAIYLPQNWKGESTTAVLTVLHLVPEALPSPVPALEEAMRTLALVALGGATGDQVLLKQGAKHYGRALSSLRISIARPSALHYEHTFAAIMVLLLCSHHDEIKLVDDGWVKHMWGAQQYFVALNSKSFHTPLGARAFSLARYASLNFSLLARKASVFARFPHYVSVPNDHGPKWSAMLFDISLQIPALLERHDKVMELHDVNWSDLEALEADCAEIERRLRDWNRQWTARCALLGVEVFRELSIDYFQAFSTRCSNRAFTSAYWFEDSSYVFLAVWYWISMYFIFETKGSLQVRRQGVADGLGDPALHLTTLRLARNMCMCIPFLYQEQCGVSGATTIMLPLKVAGAFFQRHGMGEYVRWAVEVRRTAFDKGVSPPTNAAYQRPP